MSQPAGELTLSDVVRGLAADQRRKQEAEDSIAAWKQILGEMREKGLIEDKAEVDGYTVAFQTRAVWQYSPAIKQAQQFEQLEGLATKTTSGSWVLRQKKLEF